MPLPKDGLTVFIGCELDIAEAWSGLGILMGYFHTPYVGDNYDHFAETPLYLWAGISVL